jgi:HPt (histidine-containing phosphotransfer) domain-containing protein
MSEEAKFDLAFLNKISGGDKDFIKEMIITFKEMAPEFIENSKRFLYEANYESLSREVHKLFRHFFWNKTSRKDMV